MNTAENIFCRKNFKSLAVDARNQIQLQDTLFYGISNLRYGNYKLEIEPDRFDDSLHLAFLADRYNQSFTPLYLSSPNNYTFNVSSDPLSSATDRFYIVFRPLNPLSAHGINFTAKKLSEVVNVLHWNLIGNANIKRFVIERSESGSNFSEIGFLPAIRTNVHYNYEFRDEAANRSILYYRIKTILSDGGFEYSEVRRVIKNESDFYFTDFPNPVTDRNIFLTSKGLTGKKTVTISSASGQVMYSNEIELTDATTTLTIELPPAVSSGTYFIKITEAGSVVLTEKIVVK
jgi:hypothetical protein